MGFEQTATNIANLALSHCGISKPLQDLTSSQSVEAQMCRTWFDTARRITLAKIPWSFAVKQAAPGLVTTYPTNEWNYAYQYPSDALRLVRFMSWRLNNDTRQSRVPYRIMQPTPPSLNANPAGAPASYSSSTGLWIFTNWPGANVSIPTVIEYIFDNQDVAQWTDFFNCAMSLKLAELIVPVITSGDPTQKKAALKQDWMDVISEASGDNLNEEQRPEEPQSEFVRGRDGDMGYGMSGMSLVAESAGFSIQ